MPALRIDPITRLSSHLWQNGWTGTVFGACTMFAFLFAFVLSAHAGPPIYIQITDDETVVVPPIYGQWIVAPPVVYCQGSYVPFRAVRKEYKWAKNNGAKLGKLSKRKCGEFPVPGFIYIRTQPLPEELAGATRVVYNEGYMIYSIVLGAMGRRVYKHEFMHALGVGHLPGRYKHVMNDLAPYIGDDSSGIPEALEEIFRRVE